MSLLSFSLLALALSIIAVGFIFYAARSGRQNTDNAIESRALNVQAYKSRLSELEADLASGRVDQAQYQSLKAELDKVLLTDVEGSQTELRSSSLGWQLPAIASAFVLVLTYGLYSYLGSSDTLISMQRQNALVAELEDATPQQRILRLEQERQRADDKTKPSITYALARELSSVGLYQDAAVAYRELLQLTGDQAELLSELAQVLYLGNNNQISDEVDALLVRVLQLDPDNSRALGLMGISAYENQQYAEAIAYWQRLLAQSPEGQGRTVLEAGIARAQAMLGDEPVSDVADGPQITVSIDLAPELAAKVKENDILFVFARATNGAAMPLAAVRLPPQFPVQVVLDDSMAMIPTATLSSASQVDIVARVSSSGTPQAQPGDLQGEMAAVDPKAQSALNILIDNVVE